MSETIIDTPELFFCLAGPVGVDLDSVSDALIQQLWLFGYKTEYIHITDLLPFIDPTL
jgi:hypothetical protein